MSGIYLVSGGFIRYLIMETPAWTGLGIGVVVLCVRFSVDGFFGYLRSLCEACMRVVYSFVDAFTGYVSGLAGGEVLPLIAGE